jgi:hypothetical protein
MSVSSLVRPVRPQRPAVLAVALIGALIVLPACGGGGGGGESKPTAANVDVTGQGKDVQVKVPETIKGGLVQLNLKNSSDGPRDAQIVRVEGNQSPEEVLKVVMSEGGPIPDWLQDGGGVGATGPGQSGSATQNLAEGNYVLFSSPEGEGEPVTAEFKVEGGGTEGQLPKTEAEIIASEYTFDAKGLKPGKNKVLFKNAGNELHHAIGAPMRPGATLDDVKKFLQEEGGGGRPSGPPPIDMESGFTTAVIDGGVEQVIDLNVRKPGKHALVCFIQDRRGGPPHVMKGMLKEVEVK